MPLLLTRADVQSVLTMGEAMATVEEAFRQHALGAVDMPCGRRSRAEHHGVVLFMPAMLTAWVPSASRS